MKKRTVFCLCLCALLGLQAQNVQNYTFQHYSVEDGLSQNTVMAIMQDHKGFMWFGTWDGLNKFDGYQFTTYKSFPGDNSEITTNRVDFIYEDQLGYIWFQTYDGRFHRFDPKMELFFSLSDKTENFPNHVQRNDCFLETAPGELWIAANNGVIRVVPRKKSDTPEVIEYGSPQSTYVNNKSRFIVKDDFGNVWFGADTTLYCVSKEGTVKNYQPGQVAAENVFLSACSTETSLWIGSHNGVIWRYSYADLHFERISLGVNADITDIKVLEKRYLAITTRGAGFFVYDTKTAQIQRFYSGNTTDIKSDDFFSITIDSYGIAWLESKQTGIFRYRHKDQSIKLFSPKVDAVHSYSVQPNLIIFEDVNQRLWINLQGGGFSWYNRDKDCLEYFFNEPESPNCRFSNVIHTAFSDKDGNLWLSTYNKGLEKIVASTSQFQLVRMDEDQNTLTSNEVRAMIETSDGLVLASTKDGRTRCFSSTLKELGSLCSDGTVANHGSFLTDLVYCMYQDAQNQIWLGTKGGGLLLLTPRYQPGEQPSYTIQRFRNNSDDAYSLSNDNIYSIIAGLQGHILIGTYGGGLNVMLKENGQYRFLNANNQLKNIYPMDKCSKVRDMLMSADSTLWIGTTNGLLQIQTDNAGKLQVYYSQKLPNRTNSLSNNDVHSLHVDNSGQLWIGTFGGGLNKLLRKADTNSPAEFQAYTMLNGLYNDIVLCILEDAVGNLWLTSENAITRFDVQQETFQNFTVLIGSSDAYFSESTGVRMRSGKLMFGCNKGIYAFDPERILRSEDVPSIEFTHFQLFNKDVEIGTKSSPLKQSIGELTELTLTHTQSVFSLEYAALDFKNPEKIQYAFMLEGFEKNWNYVHTQRKATYTNLPKGTYHFRVKSTNREGVWVNNDKVMTIVVKPSFWETPVAYLLYVLLILLLLYVVYYMASIYNKLRNEVEIEQKVTDIKLRFFTNISHELRTPLSLISGPVENILRNEKITPTVREQLNVVQSNTLRMLRLINQILDFRKIQNKKMRLKIQQSRLDTLVRETCSNFNKEAFDKKINFQIVNKTEDAIVWVDRDKVDIILYNLLSNAFKFTPNGKTITVSIEEKNDFVLMKVTDEGVGIPREKRNVLFERFSSANEIQSLSNTRGSGIGLNLVKELVDLHKGYIEVESEAGKGTTFTVMFRTGKDHFGNDVDFVVDDSQHVDGGEKPIGIEQVEQLAEGKEMLSMLVVEDNDDMRTFLQNIFKNSYKVELAMDGQQGLEKAREIVPDLIISDLMMPNMDGLELTEKLKADTDLNHIPIILLTAKSAVESRLEALKFGADDYITKPFSPLYLEARVENIIEQRKRLQQSYRNELLELKPKDLGKKSPEEAFLARLLDFMERNMDNNELTVDDIVSEMALGRTVFFNKLKSLTGFSPVEFIREIRIKRAAQLLEEGKYNVTEITYMVGMNDSRYFSKCFKHVYGMTPTEYKKNLVK